MEDCSDVLTAEQLREVAVWARHHGKVWGLRAHSACT